jgi:Ca-activated chloride channel family protein
MRLPLFCVLSALGVIASASTASLLPMPSARGEPGRSARGVEGSGGEGSDAAAAAHFVDHGTLILDARLGHSSVARAPDTGGGAETFLLATVTGDEGAPASASGRSPVHMAIVVDRSGSMAGARMSNAVAAALGAVDRMRDGDRVTLVAFDTTAAVLVRPTVLDAGSRSAVAAEIRSILPGGETCISCALDTATQALDGAPGGRDEVRRILLISDGEATAGVRDVSGLRARAARAREHGFSVSTIGVDVAFDERVMAAIAQESNGRHWFVPDASALPAVFAEELGTLESAVATEATLAIEPAPGVTIEDVLDRPFHREGTRVVVPLGTFDAKQEKTLLARVRVPADLDGTQAVARMSLTYRDAVAREDVTSTGSLALEVRSDGRASAELDPFVAARLERSRTAQALTTANDLFRRGRVDEARDALARRRNELASAVKPAVSAATALAEKDKGVARPVAPDFHEQQAAIVAAQSGFASGAGGVAPAPATTAAKSAVRRNQANAADLAF